MRLSLHTRSILAVDSRNTPVQPCTAHGYRAPALVRTGFNGEFQERSGVYLLGSYRAYNPMLMCLHSPDSLSPFGRGGLNAYAYCLGDPVNRVDPTGHLPWWGMTALGLAAPALGVAGVALMSQATLGAIAVSSKVATALSVATFAFEGAAMSMPEGRSRNAMAWAGLAMGVMAAAAGAAVAFKGVAPASYSRVKDRLKNVFRSRQRPDVNPAPDVRPPAPRVIAERELSRMRPSNNSFFNRRIQQATVDRDQAHAALNRAVSEEADQVLLDRLGATVELREAALRQVEDCLFVAQRARTGMLAPANLPDLIVDTMNIRRPGVIRT